MHVSLEGDGNDKSMLVSGQEAGGSSSAPVCLAGPDSFGGTFVACSSLGGFDTSLLGGNGDGSASMLESSAAGSSAPVCSAGLGNLGGTFVAGNGSASVPESPAFDLGSFGGTFTAFLGGFDTSLASLPGNLATAPSVPASRQQVKCMPAMHLTSATHRAATSLTSLPGNLATAPSVPASRQQVNNMFVFYVK
jgi:hypothetical protein